MNEQKYLCPNCNGLVDYGSKFCPHCRYEFGEWGTQETISNDDGAAKTETVTSVPEESTESKKSGSKMATWAKILVAGAILFAGYQGIHNYLTPDSAAEAVIEAFNDESLEPVEAYYDDIDEKDRYQEMYLVANAFIDVSRGLTETPYYYQKINKILAGLDTTERPDMIGLESAKYYYNERGAYFNYLYDAGKALLGNAKEPKIYEFINDPQSAVKNVDGYVLKKSNDSYLVYDYFGFGFWRRDAVPDVSRVMYTINANSVNIDQPGVYNFDVVEAGQSHITEINGFEYDVPEYKVITADERERIRNCNMLKDMLWYETGRNYFDELDRINRHNIAVAMIYGGDKPERITYGDGFTPYTDTSEVLAKYGEYELAGPDHDPAYAMQGIGVYFNPVVKNITTHLTIGKGIPNSLGVTAGKSTKEEVMQKLNAAKYYYTDRDYALDVISTDGSGWHFMFDSSGVLRNIATEPNVGQEDLQDFYKKYQQQAGSVENRLYKNMSRDEFIAKVKQAYE